MSQSQGTNKETYQSEKCLNEISATSKIGNACLVAGSMALGDYVGQRIEQEKKEHFDWNVTRSVNMGQVGFFVSFPSSYYWNVYLVRKFPFPTVPEASVLKALARRTMAQITLMPVMVSVQFTAITLFGKGTLAEAWRKIEDKLFGTVLGGLAYWPIVGLFMNLRVPFRHRPLIGSMFGFVFSAFMSLRVHGSGKTAAPQSGAAVSVEQ